jgi:hypothetical protein
MNLRRAFRGNFIDVAMLLFCLLLHYYLFSQRYISRTAIMSGDTQVLWSVEYLTLYSIRVFNEFPWWDPTGLNGWPAHYAMLSGAYNYLNPFQLFSLIGFKVVSLVRAFDINSWLILQKTLYYFILNLLGVYLIARELIGSRMARFFVLIGFTISEIQFHGFRDAYMFAAMPAGLFLLYALIRYAHRQDPRNLILLTLLGAVFLSSLCYGVALASFYWIGLFMFFLVLLQPSLIPSSIELVRRCAETRRGQLLTTAALVLIVSALTASLTPVIVDAKNLIRVAGSHPIRYTVVTDWPAPAYGGGYYQVWVNLMAWMPFPDVHASRLKFDPWDAGLDHRYIGLATLPLMAIALVCRLRNRLVASIFLTIFICTGVLIYTYKNLAFRGLMEKFVFFQNVRTMPGLLPRDGPSLLMILLAGIGLDILLTRSRRGPLAHPVVRSIVLCGLAALLVMAALCVILVFSPAFADIRRSLSHIGVYLGFYAFICLLLLATDNRSARRVLGITLLILVFTDLTLSSSFYWDRGLVWTEAGAVPQHRMPTPGGIGPISDESQGWPGSYQGQFHNIFTPPFYGKREWLTLALDPRLVPMLENWNAKTRRMTAYPYFKFFTGGMFLPFERIKEIDTVPSLIAADGELVERGRQTIVRISGKEYMVESGLAGFVEHVDNADKLVKFSGWAIDEGALSPAASVAFYVSGRLWARGIPSGRRPDVGGMNQGYLFSGFQIVADGAVVPRESRTGVRAFAITKRGTAKELNYSAGYPFSRAEGRSAASAEKPVVPPGPVYLHDEVLTRNAPKNLERLEVPWKITRFTLNRVSVRVSMPQDGLMMFLDNYHPYWRAWLDGKHTPIYRANFTFKLVQVPSGTHEIEWVFDPYPVKWAWVFFYAALIAFVFLAWIFRESWTEPGVRVR